MKRPLTQAIGRLTWEAGFEGLLAPAAANPPGANLVYFPERRRPESSVAIYHPEELPPHLP